MGIFDKIFGSKQKELKNQTAYKTLTAYAPKFTNWSGSIYENELVRSAIDTRARHCSKLQVEFGGPARKIAVLKKRPNEYQTWSQFLYRVSTILDIQNNCFIVPIISQENQLVGYYPALPQQCEVVDFEGQAWLKYRFANNQTAVVEFARCGLMTKYQYKDDFFGDNNHALKSTLELINIQNQGIAEGVKNNATYRFMAQANNFMSTDDLSRSQENFVDKAFNKKGGVLLFPHEYTNIKQIESNAYTINKPQLDMITKNVCDYYGVNEDVMQNKAIGDSWNAFYEGAIEPFAIQFSEVMEHMTFDDKEIANGAFVKATANRLQYASTNEKLQVSSQLTDRGVLSANEVREIWNLSPIENGDERYIRGEYVNTNEKGKDNEEDKQE